MHNLIHFHRYILILFLKGLTNPWFLVGVGKLPTPFISRTACLFQFKFCVLIEPGTKFYYMKKKLGIYCLHQHISFTEIAYFLLAHVWLLFFLLILIYNDGEKLRRCEKTVFYKFADVIFFVIGTLTTSNRNVELVSKVKNLLLFPQFYLMQEIFPNTIYLLITTTYVIMADNFDVLFPCTMLGRAFSRVYNAPKRTK